jgi:peptidoglycan/LPS O-acetylase OafA/YrhL
MIVHLVKSTSLSFEEYRRQSRIENLDGLRGIAILLVLLHHIPDASVEWIAQLQEHAKHGVSLFFVISGYIITTLLLREDHISNGVNVRDFLIRRTLRLWPLYFAVLLMEAFLVFGLRVYSPENQSLFADKLPCYVLYCSNWLESSTEGPFFVSWSLAVEEQFYLFVALLLLFVRPRFLPVAAAVLLASKAVLVNLWPEVRLANLPWRVLLSYSEAILLGVLLAVLLDNRRAYKSFVRGFASRAVILAIFMIFAGYLILGPLEGSADGGALLFYVICTLIVGMSAVRPALPVIGGRILSSIGLISYGIYLMHMPILSAVKKITNEPALVLVLTMAVVFPVAWMSYTYFEEPIRRLGRNARCRTNSLKKQLAWSS